MNQPSLGDGKLLISNQGRPSLLLMLDMAVSQGEGNSDLKLGQAELIITHASQLRRRKL